MFGKTLASVGDTFLKTWRTLPFPSTYVLTNSYPGIDPGSLVPFSDGLIGFPSSSTHEVITFVVGVVIFSYTCSTSQIGSFLVSTNL